MARTIVVDPDGRLRHVLVWDVFLDAQRPAACKHNPWPGEWTEATSTDLPLCMACVNAVRNGK